MKLHGNARTCPNSRRLLVDRVCDQSWSVTAAAQAAGISERNAYRWLARWREQGTEGLSDRSSAPKRIPHRTSADRVQAIGALRSAHDRRGDRRGAEHGTVDSLGRAQADRPEKAIETLTT
jgi:hypothetical protein